MLRAQCLPHDRDGAVATTACGVVRPRGAERLLTAFPVTRPHAPTVALSHPDMAHPVIAGTGCMPISRHPFVTAANPVPITGNPNIAGSGRHADHFLARRRR